MTQFADQLGLPLIHSGKVRELYQLPNHNLLMVATDNVSAFDFVLSPTIPDKGVVLTQLSLWWFDQLKDIVPNHLVNTSVPQAVAGRAIECEPLEMIPIECVARGYLTGSGWFEYQANGTVCGIPLDRGLVDGSKLPTAIFTPASKAPMGEHDENITFDQMAEQIGLALSEEIERLSLEIYTRAAEIAEQRGIILADTKFEFGVRSDGAIVLADEVLTPDSSRFWDAATWIPGERQDSFDKQFLRDWLTKESGWNKSSDAPPPPLPEHIVQATGERYQQAYARLTGSPLDPSLLGTDSRPADQTS